MWWLVWALLGLAAYLGSAILVGKLFAIGTGAHPNAPHPDEAARRDLNPDDNTASTRDETPQRENRALLTGVMSAIGATITAIFTVP